MLFSLKNEGNSVIDSVWLKLGEHYVTRNKTVIHIERERSTIWCFLKSQIHRNNLGLKEDGMGILVVLLDTSRVFVLQDEYALHVCSSITM